MIVAFVRCYNSTESEPAGKLVIAAVSDIGAMNRSTMVTNTSTSEDIERVSIVITGNHISNPIIYNLVKVNSQWQGIIGDVTAGNVSVNAEAFDGEGTLIFFDSKNITVANNQVHDVYFILEPVSGSPDISLKAPYIISVDISKYTIAPGETINLSVEAVDPDNGIIRYVWTPTYPGLYSNPSSPTTSWTAPALEGLYYLTITVIDNDFLIDKLSFLIDVKNKYGSGKIPVIIGVNNHPEIISLRADHTRLEPGQTTSLFLTAFDSDGDSLSYLWTSTCDGSFNDTFIASPKFIVASSANLGDCILQVQIDDSDLTTQGSVLIHVLDEAESNKGPDIISFFQSAFKTTQEGSVILIIKAKDPEGKALNFTWKTPVGTFSDETVTAITNGYKGKVTWTAPGTFNQNVVITADIADDKGVITTVTFMTIAPQ